MKMNNRKGFTLAELLIVVAIIAVLVAIAIPVFTAQLEKAREATDAANLRAAYAENMAAALLDNQATTPPVATVSQRQTVAGWQTNAEFASNFSVQAPGSGTGTWTLTYGKDASGLIVSVSAAK